MNASGLNIRWEGYERVRIHRSRRTGESTVHNTRTFNSERTIFDEKFTLCQAPNGVMAPGQFAANFQYQLPSVCVISVGPILCII